MNNLPTYLTALLGIIAVYATFRYQQRLKAFELFLQRRDTVLAEVESMIRTLQRAGHEDVGDKRSASLLGRWFVDDALVLYHKIKGGDFGPAVDMLADTYFAVVRERYSKRSSDELEDIRNRALNVLTLLYGVGHSSMSQEIGALSFSLSRQVRRFFERRRFAKPKKLPEKV